MFPYPMFTIMTLALIGLLLLCYMYDRLSNSIAVFIVALAVVAFVAFAITINSEPEMLEFHSPPNPHILTG